MSGPDDPVGGPPPVPRPERDASFARHAGLGLQFAVTVCLAAGAGYWIDARLGSSPAALLVGVLLGFVGALYSLIRHVPPAHGRKH